MSPPSRVTHTSNQRLLTRQNATGYQLSIPMPGHPIPPASVAQAQKDVEQLESLFDTHDAVFLLMDSRESRWLPTVLGAAKGKVRPGLFLAGYLDDTTTDRVERGLGVRHVPRHAARCARRYLRVASQRSAVGMLLLQRHRRACGRACVAFIIIIVSFLTRACSQSLSDRTLDQMCTVTRPGLASIASSTAVELLVSLLQHPDG